MRSSTGGGDQERPAFTWGVPGFRSLIQRAREWLAGHFPAVRWILLGLLFLCGTAVFPPPSEYRRATYKLGTIQPTTIIAAADFPIRKDPEQLEMERRQAMSSVPMVLVLDDSVRERAFAELDMLAATLERLRSNEAPDTSARAAHVALSQEAFVVLLTGDLDLILEEARSRLSKLYEHGILDEGAAAAIPKDAQVTLVMGNAEWVGTAARFVRISEIDSGEALESAGLRSLDDPAAERTVREIVRRFAWPNVRLDEELTGRRRQLAADAVDPNLGIVLKGEKIVGAHERITPEVLRKLESYEDWKSAHAAELVLKERILSLLGRLLLLGLALAAFTLYLYNFRKEILEDQPDLYLLWAILAVFFLVSGLCLNTLNLPAYLIPVAGFGVLIVLLYDSRLALVAAAFMTATVGLLSDQGLEFAVTIGLGSAAAIMSVRRLTDRRQIYRLLVFIPLVHLVSLTAMSLVRRVAFEQALIEGLYLLGSPFISVGLAFFAVPVSESLTGKCTNLTLLELLDLNRPLMRRLMLEAPGTYHHSLMVAALAEAGASAIGADPLVARVAGYYHDIGKLTKPEYFIENQRPGEKNPHDKMKPAMSRLILAAHVRDGLALAREYRLPRVVRDAIAQHHGTCVMAYFYHKAKEEDPEVPDTEYRYPGPRPQSREMAVLMLADQIDAASRSLEEPTPSRLKGLIKELSEKRALEGELDESNLTLKDLAALREAFLPILVAIFRGRITYPASEQPYGKPTQGASAEQAEKTEGRQSHSGAVG